MDHINYLKRVRLISFIIAGCCVLFFIIGIISLVQFGFELLWMFGFLLAALAFLWNGWMIRHLAKVIQTRTSQKCLHCGSLMEYIKVVERIQRTGELSDGGNSSEEREGQNVAFEQYHCRSCGCNQYEFFRFVNPYEL